jgi:hypothetical protein
MNVYLIQTLRSRVYTYIGYKGGASHFEVATAGIAWGGKAAEAGRAILAEMAK